MCCSNGTHHSCYCPQLLIHFLFSSLGSDRVSPIAPRVSAPQSAPQAACLNIKKKLVPPSGPVVASCSGPDLGITDVPNVPATGYPGEIAGCDNWNLRQDFAYGLAVSLYERNVLDGGGLSGDPIADVYAILAHRNSAILAVADGASWGFKPRLAAKCAVRAVMDTLNSSLKDITQVNDVFHAMNTALWNAQRLILKNGGTMTTLSVAVVVQLKGSLQWGLCTMSLGDSPIFVYQPSQHRLVQVSHEPVNSVKVLTDCGGCLGPCKGDYPDLSNLNFAFTCVSPGDIVFAATDGIADNFRTGCMWPSRKGEGDNIVENLQDRLEEVYRQLGAVAGYHFTAQDLVACLARHAQMLTHDMRGIREEMQRIGLSRKSLAEVNPELHRRLCSAPGKLDHASVVAYEVPLISI